MNKKPLGFWSDAPSAADGHTEPDIVFGKSHNVRVKKTIAYIVCGLILRGSKDDAEILMIQEVAGDWYLPAGRMEAGESIEDGMKREVKEEAGIDCESLGLVAVETGQAAWYRFSYLARYSGGTLKTLAQRDNESRQAAWIRVDALLNGSIPSEMRLRSRDILRLVRLAMTHCYAAGNTNENAPLCCGRVIARPFTGLLARFILVSGNKILLRRGHFPLVEHALYQRIGEITMKFLEKLGTSTFQLSETKAICVEILPIPAYEHDGCCLSMFLETALFTLTPTDEQDGYEWIDYSDQNDLRSRIEYWKSNYASLHM